MTREFATVMAKHMNERNNIELPSTRYQFIKYVSRSKIYQIKCLIYRIVSGDPYEVRFETGR